MDEKKLAKEIVKEQARAKQRKVIEAGAFNYIVKWTFIFTIFSTIIFNLIFYFMMGYEIDYWSIRGDLLIWGIGGLLFSILSWNKINKDFKKRK